MTVLMCNMVARQCLTYHQLLVQVQCIHIIYYSIVVYHALLVDG